MRLNCLDRFSQVPLWVLDAEWLECRRHNTVFTDIAATQPGAATLPGDSEPDQVPARKTTANLWGVLGGPPVRKPALF
jgi:hypothetical protein